MRIRDRSIIIMLSRGMTQATTVVLGIILVRIISKQTLGTYRQVNLVYMFLASVMSLQLSSSLYYFIPKLGVERRRMLLMQTFLVTLALAFVIGCVMFFGAEFIARMFNNPGLVPLIRIFAVYPFAQRLVILVPAFMISLDRPWRAGVYSLVASVGRIAAVVTTFALGFELPTVMWSVVAVGTIVALIGCVDMARLCPSGKWLVEPNLIIEQFQYAWPLIAGTIVAAINLQLNKIIISIFFEPDTYAVYSCGVVEFPVIALVTWSVSAAMMPNLVVMAEKGRVQEALYTWQEAARKCSLIIFPWFAFFLVVGHDFIVFIWTQDYSMASWPFRVYLFSLPLRVAVYGALLRAVGKTKPIAIGAVIGLVVNIVLSTTFVIIGRGALFSFIGPTLGMVCASWCTWSYLLWQLTRVTSVPFSRIMRWKELGLMLLVSISCGIVVFVVPLPGMPLVIKLVVQAAIYLVVFLAILLKTGMLKEDEKQLLYLPLSVIRRLRSAFKSRR